MFIHTCYNYSMNETVLKQMVRELLEPLLDGLVDVCMRVYGPMVKSFPDDMPLETQQEIIKQVLSAQNASVLANLKDAVPEDLEAKLKEAMNGGK